MTKYDWLELTTRVLGVWFVASGILGVFSTIDVQLAASKLGVESGFGGALSAVGSSFLGTCMVLLAPGFVGWLQTKDARARARTHPSAEKAGLES